MALEGKINRNKRNGVSCKNFFFFFFGRGERLTTCVAISLTCAAHLRTNGSISLARVVTLRLRLFPFMCYNYAVDNFVESVCMRRHFISDILVDSFGISLSEMESIKLTRPKKRPLPLPYLNSYSSSSNYRGKMLFARTDQGFGSSCAKL